MTLLLETPRLLLRPQGPQDIEAIVAGLGDFEVTRFLTIVPFPYSRFHAEEWVARLRPPTLERAIFSIVLPATGEMIGMRESRGIRGLYTVTVDDAVRGARFDDAVCRATYAIDIHSGNPDANKGIANTGHKAKPFDIPLRALLPRDVTALLTAGRCISGDHFAHGSYRISGNASATGEAAGRTAGIAARSNRLPHEVKFGELRLPSLDG